MKILKAASWPILVTLLAPVGALVLTPSRALTFERVDEYEITGVILEQVEYGDRPATAIEYESRGFRDWSGMAKSAIGFAEDHPNPIARIADSVFSDGTIEVELASTIVSSVLGMARGFAGIAFRISPDMETYEVIYVRPANGRVDSELRRSRALQYASHPSFHFDISREETPGVYEAEADIGLDEWIKLRIEVEGEHASVFINGELAMTIDDLKLGAGRSGGVALWVGIGTKAYFSNLKITPSTAEPHARTKKD